jgi:hypothetical protein
LGVNFAGWQALWALRIGPFHCEVYQSALCRMSGVLMRYRWLCGLNSEGKSYCWWLLLGSCFRSVWWLRRCTGSIL